MKKIVLAKCFAGATACLLWGITLVDCGSTPPDSVGGITNVGGTSGGTSSFTLPDASTGSGGGSTGVVTPTADAYCGLQTAPTAREPTDVLLVLDRSGSMSENIAEDCCCTKTCANATGKSTCKAGSGCTERWPALTSAVKAAIDATPQINWGLKFFSSSSSGQGSGACKVNNGVDVAIDPAAAATTAATIERDIAGTTPGGSTPTAAGITNATAYLKTVKDQNKKVILLATDGEPNCKAGTGDTNASDAAGAEAAIAAALAAGFKVYVVGISPADNKPTLTQFAVAGGTGDYYPATSATDLTNALASISKAVSSCTFAITAPSANSDTKNIAVYVDDKLVANDPANGWSLGANGVSVTLNGSTCDAVTAGTASKVQVYFGCPGSALPVLL